MGISIFENKTSDIFAGSAVKAESSSGKTTGDEFSKVFEGCVNECVDAVKVEGKSEGVKAGVAGILVNAAASTENLQAGATPVEGESGYVKADTLGSLVSTAVSTVKSTVEAVRGEGESGYVKADTLGSLVSTAVSTVKSMVDAVKVEGEKDGVKADVPVILTGSAVSTVKSMVDAVKVEGEKDGVKADIPVILTGSAVSTENSPVDAQKMSGKTTDLEKTLESRGKIEEEGEDEDIDEAEETGKSVDPGRASVLAGVFVLSEKSSPAASPEKAPVKEAAVKSRKTGKEGAKAAEASAQKPSPAGPEEKVSAAEAGTGKTRAGLVPETLNAPASMKAPVGDTAVPERKIVAAAENENGKVEAVRTGNDASEKAGIKAAPSDKRVLTGENTPVVPVLTDEHSVAAVDQDQPDTGLTAAPEQAKAAVEAVKDHRNLPAPDHAPALRTDELNAGGESAGPVAGNRENTLYPNTKPGGSDLSENRDERGGKGEGVMAGPVTGLSHGAIHVNTEKFPVDALSAKPAETVKPEAVFEKLSTGVRMSLGGNGREVSLNLAPEHLGVLHIRMSIEESSVKARIIVESEAAKTILDSDSGKLREVFARQGLTLDRYTVELGANAFSESSSPFSESAARENPYGARSHRGGHAERPDNTIETKLFRQSENTRRASGGIDLFA